MIYTVVDLRRSSRRGGYCRLVRDGVVLGESPVCFGYAVLDASKRYRDVRVAYKQWNHVHSDDERLCADLVRIGCTFETMRHRSPAVVNLPIDEEPSAIASMSGNHINPEVPHAE